MTSVVSLKRKRGTIKAKLTRFEGTLNDASRHEPSALRSRMKDAETLLSAFEKIQDELDELEDNEEDNLAERVKFEDDYHRCMGKANTLLDRPISLASASISQSESTIKLPTINLPTFDGNFEHWLHFHDSFKSLIHDNAALSESQKFHYLRSSLRDVAAEVIRSLEVSAANYIIAWDLLKKRFDQRHLMVSSHLQAILDLTPISGDVGTSLRILLDNLQKHTRALQTLKANTWDALLIHIVMNKVDTQTRREWRTFVKDNETPKNDALVDFLEDRCAIMYSGNPIKTVCKSNVATSARTNAKSKSKLVTCAVAKVLKCVLCQESHNLYQCSKFKELPIQARKNEVAKFGLCVNCLREHHGRACTFSRCKTCDKFHNTLLHLDKPQQTISRNNNTGTEASTVQPRSSSAEKSNTDTSFIVNHYHRRNERSVLLSTALVLIHDQYGRPHQCRALLDGGSELNLITKDLGNKLGFPKKRVTVSITGVNGTNTNVSETMHLEMHSRYNGYRADASFNMVDTIVPQYPTWQINTDLQIPDNLTLADPTFDRPGRIDLIVGAEFFLELLCAGQIRLGKGKPVMQKTKLGWIIGGKIANNSEGLKSGFCGYISNQQLNEELQRFWKIEDDIEETFLSEEERRCETHFTSTYTRDASGRFTVSLPLRGEIKQLGNSKDMAVRRFYSLERKFKKLPDLYHQYAEFMKEYVTLNHMTEITDECDNSSKYHIPHHAVIKESSTTTKLRVVFDASAKTSNNVSLNELLMVGPTIQQDLLSILLRFRQHKYVFTADIEKMYRQINVAPRDRALQRIVWRATPNETLRIFELNTVTYGLSSSPYLAIRCLFQLAEDNRTQYPESSDVIKNDFYVDDLLSGAETLEEAKKIKTEISKIMATGGFHLRKWMANDAALLEVADDEHEETTRNISEENKTLGLLWNYQRDELRYTIHETLLTERPTKRNILSTIAQIFDPLGLVGPVVVRAKVMLQKLWLLKIGWDESIPLDLHTAWIQYVRQLPQLREIRVPRGVRPASHSTELHGFCDASETAYGACVYVRSLVNGAWVTRLLCAKSKVAPVKNISLPRLELCGALVLTKLIHKVRRSFTIRVTTPIYWCDSTIALAWISGEPCQWKTFIANRVAEIQKFSDKWQWKHIRSEDNPADIISRGSEPQLLKETSLWWNGPVWLAQESTNWPIFEQNTAEEIPEAKPKNLVLLSAKRDLSIFDKYSSLSKIKRVTAYCLRFINNASTPEKRTSGPLTIMELEGAFLSLIKLAQEQEYSLEISTLSQGRELPTRSKILSLTPFLDKDGVIRVGGRLQNAELSYEQRHPVLLPPRHPLTRLIIRDEHYRSLHAGTEALLAIIRTRFWIVAGKNTIKDTLRRCVVCFRARPKTLEQLMGDLPASRVTPSRPFARCGVDYAGPFLIKISRNKTGKAYLCLFICFSVKAIHLELVSDLSTNAFLNAFKRFISRRGKPSDVYSDNGTNFVGANNELKEALKLWNNDKHDPNIMSFCTQENINWHFIPAHSPHFGGLWEAGVRSVKTHVRRIIGKTTLTFEELYTVFTLIEACVNSRPLVPVSNDPTDLTPLTPGHFLIGAPITALPQPTLLDTPVNRLTKYQYITQLQQHFWSRWSIEYLTHLQQRIKWNRAYDYSKLAGALVILKDDNVPPLQWRMARIVEIHPGKDGLVRVVTIKTKGGTSKRAVGKICVLPIEM